MTRKTSKLWVKLRPVAVSALVTLVALALAVPAIAGDLRAYLDRKSVYEGDTVTLAIETTGGALGEPDLSGLNADFDLLGTSQSTNISIINGRRTDTVRLLVTLAPKRVGAIEISPIRIGTEQTAPLSLEVSEVPQGGSGSSGDDIFVELEVDADSRELMVQQQVPLTLRLYTAVPLLKGSLEDPRAEGALVTQLGEDRRYSTRRDGREYQVVERRYTLSPERSGELRIPPVAFEGSVRSKKGSRRGIGGSMLSDPFFDRFFQNGPLTSDPFGMFGRGEPVGARSRAVTLDVKARPGGYAGDHWLPAESLEILDSWAEKPPELRVGEPVTRTLTLRAKGLSGPQIPEIQVPAPAGLRVYPQKPESETRSDGETVYGISRQDLTLIPSQGGTLEIPEIQVTWWDTVAQQERATSVPGWTLHVGGGGPAGVVPKQAAQTLSSSAPAEQAPPEATAEIPEPSSWLEFADPLLLAAAVALVVLLAGALAMRRRKRGTSDAAATHETSSASSIAAAVMAAEAKEALRTACDANDAPCATQALLNWAETRWPENPPRNLGALSAMLTHGPDQVRELERRLYAPSPDSWDGTHLWQALQGELSNEKPKKSLEVEPLEPLYPQRG